MIAILSPAKNMRIPSGTFPVQLPAHIAEAHELTGMLRGLSAYEWESLLAVNPDLAVRAAVNAQNWAPGGTPAALTYCGLVYRYLRAGELEEQQLAYANDHLRILSALYGPLRAMDSIRPYRLELRCGLRPRGSSLYGYWGDAYYRALAGEVIVNLASEEYASAVRPFLRTGDLMVDVEFLSYSRGKYKVIVAWAKMARGSMARFIVENRIEDPADLCAFEALGFRFSPQRSHAGKLVFLKD